ncbi:protein SCO1 [Azospirillaceae bacterium]
MSPCKQRLGSILIFALLAMVIVWNQMRHVSMLQFDKNESRHIGGAFSLIAHDGRIVSETSWPGRFLLIYFGYRFCPDVCPTSLQVMGEVMQLLGESAEAVQPLFVSVDVERDLPELLGEYVALFDHRFLGLTGSAEQIKEITKAFRVSYKKIGNEPDYQIDHSSFTYLTDDQGKILTVFPHKTSSDTMATAIRAVLTSLRRS